MSSKDYWLEVERTAREELESRRVRLDGLDAERAELVNEIVQFEQLLERIVPFTSDRPLETINAFLIENAMDMSLAEACREVLKQSGQHRTARGVRDSLEASGYNLPLHSNPLASIHGVLKRLVESGEVEATESAGKTRYRWKGKPIVQRETLVKSVMALKPITGFSGVSERPINAKQLANKHRNRKD